MPKRITGLGTAADQWVIDNGVRETDVLRRLRLETAQLPRAQMQIGPDQGQVLGFLVRLIRARRAIEIGTFTGYSALITAAALPPDGKLIACDRSEEWTTIARRYWAEAGVSDRIDLRLGNAARTLTTLESEFGPHSFDFAFIDADKSNYDSYYESCLRLIRPGGLIALDNVLWSGSVADPSDQCEDTLALRALGRKIQADERVDMCMLVIGDGVTLVTPH